MEFIKMDLKKAILCAKLSELAYHKPDEDTIKKFEVLEFEFCKEIDHNNSQCYIVHNKKSIYVIYRGTELKFSEMKDMLRNGMIWPSSGMKQGLVHSGFANATDQLWDDVVAILDTEVNLYGMHDDVTFTGHSLGGAMAIISAARSKYIADIYTCGSPRAGNAEFCKNIKSRSYRINNGNDIIPSILPPIGYRHGGFEYRIHKDIIHKTLGGWNGWKWKLKISLYHILKLRWFRSLLGDHRITEYISNLESAHRDNS